MKKIIVLFVALTAVGIAQTAWRTHVLRHDAFWQRICDSLEIPYPPRITFCVFKDHDHEPILSIYAEKSGHMVHLDNYSILATKKIHVGPKWERGDGRVPEGIYQITELCDLGLGDYALKINYPNASDSIRGKASGVLNTLGGDLFIHGGTDIHDGCIPIGDSAIEEVYVLANRSISAGNTINVYIFPFSKLWIYEDVFEILADGYDTPSSPDDDLFSLLEETSAPSSRDCEVYELWFNLAAILRYMCDKDMIPPVELDKNGFYVLK